MNKKISKIFVVMLGIIILFNTTVQAGYSFIVTEGSVDYGEMSIMQRLIGFNQMSIPYIVMIVYIIISLIMALTQKNIKYCIKFNLIIIIIAVLINIIVKDLLTGFIREREYYVYIVISAIINILLLTICLVFQKKNIYIFNKKIITVIIALMIVCIILKITGKHALVHIRERDWAFGETLEIRVYSKVLKEGNSILGAEILKIDDEGVLIQYERGYYTNEEDLEVRYPYSLKNYEYHKEIVQQKLIWNVDYAYLTEENPVMEIDGGTDYYVKFCKR